MIVTGFLKHGFGFLKLFVPHAPWYLLIMLVPIELILRSSPAPSVFPSVCSPTCWPATRCWRCSRFHYRAGRCGRILRSAVGRSMILIVAIMLLELLVAFLQAYVFAMLTCIYMNEALHLHDHH